MNTMVWNAILRYGLNAVGAGLVTHGWVANETWQQVAGFVLTVAPTVIGALSSTKAAQIKAVESHGLMVVPKQDTKQSNL